MWFWIKPRNTRKWGDNLELVDRSKAYEDTSKKRL